MQDIPAEDPAVYRMIQRADTVGVFQIESRAQMSMLPRLKPANFYDLVIEVAIVRPGPIQGGMVHPYLRRRQGKEPVTYPSEAVRSVLERTLGVPIFQEQVMQLAIVAAGFSAGEADHLRRSMAAWRRKGGLEKFEERLIEGMAARGYHEAFARQIYQQILGFGEYGFPESHSASFSLLVYVSCWLKRYHPAAFTAALINSQPMGFYAPAQLVADAQAPRGAGGERRRHRQRVGLHPRKSRVRLDFFLGRERRSVASSLPEEKVESDPTFPDDAPETWGARGPALRLGLRLIAGLSEAGAGRVVTTRAERPFANVADLAHRAKLDRRDLEALADAGALAALAGHRHDAVWNVAGVERLPGLIAGSEFHEEAPDLPAPTEGEDVTADYRRLGLTLGRHPVALLRRSSRRKRLLTSEAIRALPHGRLARTAGIVIGRQRPDTASGVVFVTLEDETGATNVIVWRDLGDKQRRELLGSRLMAVYGKVEREGEVVHLLAGRLVDLTPMLGQLRDPVAGLPLTAQSVVSWHAGKHLRARVALHGPPLRDHFVQDGTIGRVAMVGRPAHAPVVRAVERPRIGGARDEAQAGLGQPERECVALELPHGIGLDLRALAGIGRVEVRGLRGEALPAPEAAHGEALGLRHRPHVERVAGARPLRLPIGFGVEPAGLADTGRREVVSVAAVDVLDRNRLGIRTLVHRATASQREKHRSVSSVLVLAYIPDLLENPASHDDATARLDLHVAPVGAYPHPQCCRPGRREVRIGGPVGQQASDEHPRYPCF